MDRDLIYLFGTSFIGGIILTYIILFLLGISYSWFALLGNILGTTLGFVVVR